MKKNVVKNEDSSKILLNYITDIEAINISAMAHYWHGGHMLHPPTSRLTVTGVRLVPVLQRCRIQLLSSTAHSSTLRAEVNFLLQI